MLSVAERSGLSGRLALHLDSSKTVRSHGVIIIDEEGAFPDVQAANSNGSNAPPSHQRSGHGSILPCANGSGWYWWFYAVGVIFLAHF